MPEIKKKFFGKKFRGAGSVGWRDAYKKNIIIIIIIICFAAFLDKLLESMYTVEYMYSESPTSDLLLMRKQVF